MENSIDRAAKIAALNDRFRRTFIGGEVYFTAGVRALGEHQSLIRLMKAVQSADVADQEDPWGKADFGAC